MVTIYNFKVQKIHLFFLSLLPMTRLITSLLGRSQSHIEYLTITGMMQIFVLNLNVDDLAFCISFTWVWNLAYFLMISWWKMNSRSNAHTDRLHKLRVSSVFQMFQGSCISSSGILKANSTPLFSNGNFAFWNPLAGKNHKQIFQNIKNNWDNVKLIDFSLEGCKE